MLPNTMFSYHFPKHMVTTTIKSLLAYRTSVIVRWIAHYRKYSSFEGGNILTSNHIHSGNDRPQYHYTKVQNNTSPQSSSSSLCSIHCWVGRNELSPVAPGCAFLVATTYPNPDHSVMSPIHIVIGLPRLRLPSISHPYNYSCLSVLCKMIWPKLALTHICQS